MYLPIIIILGVRKFRTNGKIRCSISPDHSDAFFTTNIWINFLKKYSLWSEAYRIIIIMIMTTSKITKWNVSIHLLFFVKEEECAWKITIFVRWFRTNQILSTSKKQSYFLRHCNALLVIKTSRPFSLRVVWLLYGQ